MACRTTSDNRSDGRPIGVLVYLVSGEARLALIFERALSHGSEKADAYFQRVSCCARGRRHSNLVLGCLRLHQRGASNKYQTNYKHMERIAKFHGLGVDFYNKKFGWCELGVEFYSFMIEQHFRD